MGGLTSPGVGAPNIFGSLNGEEAGWEGGIRCEVDDDDACFRRVGVDIEAEAAAGERGGELPHDGFMFDGESGSIVLEDGQG